MSRERTAFGLNDSFRIGDRLVTRGANEIDGWRVDSKAMEVLVELAAQSPNVVSAQTLLDLIWPPPLVVVYNVVHQAVMQLRKTLGDDARAPRYIETVPRRGYRVVAPITFEPQQTRINEPPAQSRPPHNLPAQLTSFIGREREMSQIGDLLAAHRIVTLTGVGGCGKTRLALDLANAHVDDFDDGIWLVELAPVTEPAQVEWSVAKVLELNVRAAPEESLRTRLLESVADKRLLLILDNCEHLIGACADLAEALLRDTQHLRVLATSREALGVRGEHQCRVQSLATPDLRQFPTLDQLAAIESVRLFTERAGLAQPGFALTAQNAPALAQICSRLDGIPLAIELAAARVHALSVDDIATRLAKSFGLLTRGNRTASPRQRTLQATLDWSYALLEKPQRVLLSRLAVFANGFTLAAAEAVGAGDGLAADDVVDLLARLVEQSIVEMVGTVGGRARYRLLEPMRQYAQERLDDSGEELATLDRHRDYFISLASQLERELTFDGGVPVIPQFVADRFLAEQDNFELALAWCAQSNQSLGLGLAKSLTPIWPESSSHSSGDGAPSESNGSSAETSTRELSASFRIGDRLVTPGANEIDNGVRVDSRAYAPLSSGDGVPSESDGFSAETTTRELSESFRIGDRLVTPGANEIDGVRVDSKAMEVLVALAEGTPNVISAEVLLKKIWPDVIVVDNIVYQAVAQLRRILGDDPRASRYIETVPRRGYRLIAPVSPVERVTPVATKDEEKEVEETEMMGEPDGFSVGAPSFPRSAAFVSAMGRAASRLRDWLFGNRRGSSSDQSLRDESPNPGDDSLSNDSPLRQLRRIPIGLPKRYWG